MHPSRQNVYLRYLGVDHSLNPLALRCDTDALCLANSRRCRRSMSAHCQLATEMFWLGSGSRSLVCCVIDVLTSRLCQLRNAPFTACANLTALTGTDCGTAVVHVSAVYFCEDGCGAHSSGLPLLHTYGSCLHV